MPKRYLAILALIVLGGVSLRLLILPQVLVDGKLYFLGADSFYFAFLIDYIAQAFPSHLTYTALINYPEGLVIPHPQFFEYVAALIGICCGDPALAAASLSAALIAPLIILAFMFSHDLYRDPRLALLSASVAAFTGMQLLTRSRFGFVDHHIAEAVLLFAGMFFLNRSMQKGSRKAAVIAGIFFTLYALVWDAPQLLYAVLAPLSCFWILRQKVDANYRLANIVFSAGHLITLPAHHDYLLAVLAGGNLLLFVASAPLFKRYSRKKALLFLAGVFVLAAAIVGIICPRIFTDALYLLKIAFSSHQTRGISEMLPFFGRLSGVFTQPVMALNATFVIVALGCLIFSRRMPLVFWWSAVIAVITLFHAKFGYYFFTNISLLLPLIARRHRAVLVALYVAIFAFLWTYKDNLVSRQNDFPVAVLQGLYWLGDNAEKTDADNPAYCVACPSNLGYAAVYYSRVAVIASPANHEHKLNELYLNLHPAPFVDFLQKSRCKYVLSYYVAPQSIAASLRDIGLPSIYRRDKSGYYLTEEYFLTVINRLQLYDAGGAILNRLPETDKIPIRRVERMPNFQKIYGDRIDGLKIFLFTSKLSATF